MSPTDSNPPQPIAKNLPIVRVGPDQQLAAAARLVSMTTRPDEIGAERFLEYAAENAISLEHFYGWQMKRDVFDAAVLAVPNPGRTAMVFINRATRPPQQHRTVATLNAACEKIAMENLSLAQGLIETNARPERALFEAAGFHVLADLVYLQRSLKSKLPSASEIHWPRDITLETWQENLRPAFTEALAASYEQTLDCPDLTGRRKPSDILSGHQATGQFSPDLWTLLRVDNQPAGVLLLNRSTAEPAIELIYIGLSQQARRRGLGKKLLMHAVRSASADGAKHLSLAVDASNTPATNMYYGAGFRKVLTRTAMIRQLNEVNSTNAS